MLLCGVLGRFVIRCLRSAEMGAQLIADIGLGIKKGMPRPDEEYLDRGAKKAFIALTTTRAGLPDVVDLEDHLAREAAFKANNELKRPEPPHLVTWWGDLTDRKHSWPVDRKESRRRVKQMVYELFKGTSFLEWAATKNTRPFPSTSSTNTSSRREGGGFADVQKAVVDSELFDEKEPLLKFTQAVVADDDREFMSFVSAQDARAAGGDALPPTETVWECDPTNLHLKYDMLNNTIRDVYRTGQLDNEVDIVALSEALKVRTITKGNGLRNFLLAPLQDFMWSRLRQHEIFALIGEPLTETHLLNALGGNLADGEAYLSGDYSGATDNLAPWFSEMIAEEITRECKLPEWLGKLFLEALTGHDVRDPESGELRPQRWGQLMGSLVSFPILCIANAVVCRWTLEYSRDRHLGLSDVKMLINGDDCVFKLPIRSLPAWEFIALYHGLAPSIGKYFLSRELVQMNSMNFIIDPHITYSTGKSGLPVARMCPFRYVHYINMGLYYGFGRSTILRKKVKGKLAEEEKSTVMDDIWNMSSRAHDLLRICPTRLRERVFAAYLAHHRPRLVAHVPHMSWFIPKKFGGLGLPIFMSEPDMDKNLDKHLEFLRLERQNLVFRKQTSVSDSFKPTDLDLRIAGGLVDRGETSPTPVADSKLPVRELAATFIPTKRVFTLREYDDTTTNAQACLEVLFRKRMKPEHVEGRLMKTIAGLQFRWQRLTRKSKLGSKRSALTLLSMPEKALLPVVMTNRRAVLPRQPFVSYPGPEWDGSLSLSVDW